MIKTIGISTAGPNKQRCEDAHVITPLKKAVLIAVADGVGSAEHSDKAAGLAVTEISNFIAKQKFPLKTPKETLQAAFNHTLSEINNLIALEKGEERDYDTTLSAVIYNGSQIAYGHSGDGGVIGLNTEGQYIAITKPQKGDDNISVIPFRESDKWEFGIADGDFASVIIATDGIYDTFFPYLLKGQQNEMYIRMLQFFTNSNETELREYLENATHINDDKTFIIATNPITKVSTMDDEYYQEPDWETLKLEWNKKAYPHLFSEET